MIKLYTVLPRDYDELATFLSINFSTRKEIYLDYFKFWWEDNPAYSEEFERGWVLKNNNEIKGFLGAIRTYFQIGGEERLVINATSWCVAEEFRSKSMVLGYAIMKASKNSILFNTSGSPRVTRMSQAAGFEPIPRSVLGKSFILLDCNNLLKKKLKSWTFLVPIISLCSPILNTYQTLRLKINGINGSEYVRRVEKIDSSFDDLWARTKKIYLHTNVRKACALQWSCFGNKNKQKRVFGYFKDDKLWGYLVLAMTIGYTRTWYCEDLWVDPHQKEVVPSLIAESVRQLRKEGGSLLAFHHFSEDVAREYKKMGMIKLSKKNHELMKNYSEFKNEINEQNSYFVIQGDTALA